MARSIERTPQDDGSVIIKCRDSSSKEDVVAVLIQKPSDTLTDQDIWVIVEEIEQSIETTPTPHLTIVPN